MYSESLKQYCINLHNNVKSQCFYSEVKKSNFNSEIIEKTAFLDVTVKISIRIHCIINGVHEIPKCYCGNLVEFKSYKLGFKKYCSVKCSANSTEKKEKIIKTNLEKYGCVNAFQTEAGRKAWDQYNNDSERVDKANKNGELTRINNLGVETIKEARSLASRKGVQTNIKNHNGVYFSNWKQGHSKRNFKQEQEKIKKTCMAKYGVESPMQHPASFEKQQKAMFRKKEYMFPSGNIAVVQGYESWAIDELLITYDESELIVGSDSRMPAIWYADFDNRRRRYYPDIFIEKDNLIIEVKSTYTMQANYEINMLKKKATEDIGFNFKFIIFDDKRNKKII